MACKPREANPQHALSRMSIASHPRRVEDLGGEVAAENSPGRAVEGGADGMLITAENFADGEGLSAISENSALLDQGLVGEGIGGDEYDRARAEMDCEDWAVLAV